MLRHAIGRDDRQRMRMKRDHRRRTIDFVRALDDAANDRLMSDMHPVEVADRGDAAARKVGLPEWIGEYEHARILAS